MMTDKKLLFSQKIFEEFCSYLEKVMGLLLPKESQKGIEHKICSIVHAFDGAEDPDKCLITLMRSPVNEKFLSKLAQFLSVGETYFFRDSSFFSLLERQILPDLIRRKQNRHIRICSMGCATGEEPYSIAILLHRLIPDIAGWNIEIIGSDINTKFLRRAEIGIYKKWSFRATSPEMQAAYFENIHNERWLLTPVIRSMVTFRYANLADTGITNTDFDLILCNNVLIYFTPEKITQAVYRLSGSLVEGGLLCVTSIEVPYIQNPYLIPCYFDNIILFKKTIIPKTNDSFFVTQSVCKPEASGKKPEPVEYFKIPESFNKTQLPESKPNPSEEIPDPFAEVERLFKSNQYSRVAERVESILENYKDDSALKQYLPYIHLLIQSYANQKKLEEALTWSQRYLEIHALEPEIYCLQAKILQELERPHEAVDSLRRALYLDSNLVMAHFEMGCLLLRERRLKDSDRHFRNALQLLEQYPEDANVPGTEGIAAGQLKNIILSKNTL